jgi:hypothetical protein
MVNEINKAAIITGVGLLIMALLAPIANFSILPSLIDLNNPAATVENISASQGLFRIGIGLLLFVAILDIMVAWGFYVVMKPVKHSLSLLTAWFRLIYAAVFLCAILSLTKALQLVNLPSLDIESLNAMVMVTLKNFRAGWDLGLIIFGFHLALLGFLMVRSRFVPKLLGVLILIAATGYLIDGVGTLLFANYGLTISEYTFAGEVVIIFWLLIRGGKIGKNI